MRRLAVLPILVAAACASAAEPQPAATEIYLQRGADGRAVISDQPRRGVAVEKTWRMEREDADAARQRAADVKREAAATSARVQRTIDAQQERLALAERQRARDQADEAERLRVAELRAEAERPVVLVDPWLGGRSPRWQDRPGWHGPPGTRPGAGLPNRDRTEPPRRRPHAPEPAAAARPVAGPTRPDGVRTPARDAARVPSRGPLRDGTSDASRGDARPG